MDAGSINEVENKLVLRRGTEAALLLATILGVEVSPATASSDLELGLPRLSIAAVSLLHDSKTEGTVVTAFVRCW